MTACLMRRTVSGLCADDDAASEVLRKLAPGDVVRVDVQRPRSHKNLRRWFALCRLLHENCEQFTSPELAHGWLKIMAGHAVQIVSKTTGEVYLIADSISFGRLDEDEFQAIWQRAMKAVVEHVMPGITEPELEYEILSLLGMAGGRK